MQSGTHWLRFKALGLEALNEAHREALDSLPATVPYVREVPFGARFRQQRLRARPLVIG